MPPLPPWEGMHPILVHFPIALLSAAPVLVALALLRPGFRRGLAIGALVVMGMGALGAVAATASGEDTAEAAETTPEARAAEDLIEEHEEAAERARNVFLALALVYAGLVIVPEMRRKEWSRRVLWISHGAFLAAYAGGLLLLAEAGHLGGRLVHEKGIRAPVGEVAPGGGGTDDHGGRGRGRGRGGDRDE